jgi:hypothetical protein
LNGHMSQSKKGRGEPGIERADSLDSIHLTCRIPRPRVLPRGPGSLAVLLKALGHEPCLNHPDGVCRDRRACTSGD